MVKEAWQRRAAAAARRSLSQPPAPASQAMAESCSKSKTHLGLLFSHPVPKGLPHPGVRRLCWLPALLRPGLHGDVVLPGAKPRARPPPRFLPRGREGARRVHFWPCCEGKAGWVLRVFPGGRLGLGEAPGAVLAAMLCSGPCVGACGHRPPPGADFQPCFAEQPRSGVADGGRAMARQRRVTGSPRRSARLPGSSIPLLGAQPPGRSSPLSLTSAPLSLAPSAAPLPPRCAVGTSHAAEAGVLVPARLGHLHLLHHA